LFFFTTTPEAMHEEDQIAEKRSIIKEVNAGGIKKERQLEVTTMGWGFGGGGGGDSWHICA
jgi:hypothetical protein